MSRDVAARQEEGVRMGGVASAFTAADGSRKKAFIPFVTCGDPSIGLTEQVVRAMERAGADLIELGIPFSDPTAEGPTIREANVRALKNHVTTDEVIDMVARLRSGGLGVPLVFMTYANMHCYRYNRIDRGVILDYLLEYYRLHLHAFPPLKSLPILRQLGQVGASDS